MSSEKNVPLPRSGGHFGRGEWSGTSELEELEKQQLTFIETSPGLCQALYVHDFLWPMQWSQEAGTFVVPIFQEGNWDFQSLGNRPNITEAGGKSSVWGCQDRFPRLLPIASLGVSCGCGLSIFLPEMGTVRLVFPTERVVIRLEGGTDVKKNVGLWNNMQMFVILWWRSEEHQGPAASWASVCSLSSCNL